jgi:nucleotide-binding universal stress UspA family protein
MNDIFCDTATLRHLTSCYQNITFCYGSEFADIHCHQDRLRQRLFFNSFLEEGPGMNQEECALVKHEKILIATDGSKHSSAALDQAIGFAKLCNCPLIILHAVDINPEYLALSPKLEEKMEGEGAQLLQESKQKAVNAGVSCEVVLSKSDVPYKAIINTAKERKVDLIVMGTHGKNALEKLIMGSVTRQVIGHIPCAVLVVPA